MSAPSKLRLFISPDGTLQFIYNDLLADLASTEAGAVTCRASHVEPAGTGQGWIADLRPVGGPVLGPFYLRQEALDTEVEWLEAQMEKGVL